MARKNEHSQAKRERNRTAIIRLIVSNPPSVKPTFIEEKLKLGHAVCWELIDELVTDGFLYIKSKKKYNNGKYTKSYAITHKALVEWLWRNLRFIHAPEEFTYEKIDDTPEKRIRILYPEHLKDLENTVERNMEAWPWLVDQLHALQRLKALDLFRTIAFVAGLSWAWMNFEIPEDTADYFEKSTWFQQVLAGLFSSFGNRDHCYSKLSVEFFEFLLKDGLPSKDADDTALKRATILQEELHEYLRSGTEPSRKILEFIESERDAISGYYNDLDELVRVGMAKAR